MPSALASSESLIGPRWMAPARTLAAAGVSAAPARVGAERRTSRATTARSRSAVPASGSAAKGCEDTAVPGTCPPPASGQTGRSNCLSDSNHCGGGGGIFVPASRPYPEGPLTLLKAPRRQPFPAANSRCKTERAAAAQQAGEWGSWTQPQATSRARPSGDACGTSAPTTCSRTNVAAPFGPQRPARFPRRRGMTRRLPRGWRGPPRWHRQRQTGGSLSRRRSGRPRGPV